MRLKLAFLQTVAMLFIFASSLAALPYLGLPYDPLQITASLNSYGPEPAPANILAIYVLAFDNPPESPANLTPLLPETLPSIIDATVGDPNKRAVVLIDADDEDDTHIRVIENGVTTLIAGLPDSSGSLNSGLYEYDTADGATLGGFLKWTLDTYANESTKTIFSYVGHGVALVPESDHVPGATTSLRQATTTPGFPLPVVWHVNDAFSDYHAPIGGTYKPTLLSPYDLASALEMATNNGQNPIAVLDLVHCFAASIEEFYELSNPDGSPYAATMAGSPNYAYLNPTMLGAGLEALEPSFTDEALASTLIKTYDDSIGEGDSNPSQHPRILVAVNSDKIPPIKEAWDQTSFYLLQQFDANFNNTKNRISGAYTDSAKYETSFCEQDWALDAPDALVDMADFANQLSGEFGPLSPVASSALTTKLRVEQALINNPITNNPLFANGYPWFGDGDPVADEWTFDGNSGIALYADFEGMTIDGEKHLSWQAHWYTDTNIGDNPHPYLFVQDGPVAGVSWADVFNRFWDGQTIKTAACVPPLPPVLQRGEVSVEQIIFPIAGSVSEGSAFPLSAVIETEKIAINPAVEFTVTQNNTIVFSDTVGAGYLLTGTYQIDASRNWVPEIAGPFILTVTVDADHRISETDENNNTDTLTDIVWSSSPYPRPIITATVTNDLQWISSNVVDLDVVQASESSPPSVAALTVQLYEYQAGDNPNVQVPVNTHTETIPSVSLPWSGHAFNLPAGLNPGPIVLHVWAHSAGGLSPMPEVVKFNYAPSNTTLAAGEKQHFEFHAQRDEALQIDLDLSSGDANLFVWDPNNYGTATWVSTNIGDDTIIIDPVPTNGQYVVEVYAESNAQYTLTATRNGVLGGRRRSSLGPDNPDAYIPDARPSFVAPIPERPEVTPTISDVRMTNIRDTSLSISWQTDFASSGLVRYGTDANDLNQTSAEERGIAAFDDTHYVLLSDLLPNTTYYFDVISNDTTDDNDGARYTVTTAPALSEPASDTIFGKVFKSDGMTPAEGAMVYITLQDNNGIGTSGDAAPLSVQVDSEGEWSINLANVRTADLSDYFSYSASGDQLVLSAQGAADGMACERRVDTGATIPELLLVDSCMMIQPGWNHVAFPIAPGERYMAKDLCDQIDRQGGSAVEIDRWHLSGWQGHICGQPFNNFDLLLGSNYFVKSNVESIWGIDGRKVTAPVSLTLEVGWNSIGIPHTDSYSAKTLCDELIGQGVTAVEIDRWHMSGWQGHICGLPFNDFPIERGTGYFIKSDSSGTVIPSAPVSYRQPAQNSTPAPPEARPRNKVVPIQELQLSNLRDTSVTLSWTTDQPATGYVRFGEIVEKRDALDKRERLSHRLAYDSRGATTSRTTHYVVLDDLAPETTYYFEIISGAESQKRDQEPYTVTTLPSLEGVPQSDTIYGQVYQADGRSPATGAVVYLLLEDADGKGSPGEAKLLSSLVDQQGYWHANLGNARLAEGQEPFVYSMKDDQITLTVQGQLARDVTLTVDTDELRPAQPLTLEEEVWWQLYLPLIHN